MPPRPRMPAPLSPGFEPALGRPDPEYHPPQVEPAEITHYPSRTGPVCAVRPIPTSANAYTVGTPTCPACRDWITKTRAATAETYGPPDGGKGKTTPP
jgi:hypothetical protein